MIVIAVVMVMVVMMVFVAVVIIVIVTIMILIIVVVIIIIVLSAPVMHWNVAKGVCSIVFWFIRENLAWSVMQYTSIQQIWWDLRSNICRCILNLRKETGIDFSDSVGSMIVNFFVEHTWNPILM